MPLHSAVNSNAGNIIFDANADNQSDMLLNSTGLGIGTTSFSANLAVNGNALFSEKLTLGSSTVSDANLHIQGSMALSFETISANNSMLDEQSVYFINPSANITCYLPNSSDIEGRMVTLKNTSNLYSVTLSGNGYPFDNMVFAHLPAASSGSSIKLYRGETAWSILSRSTETTLSVNIMLSQYTNPAAVFSTDRLVSGYTGSCLVLKRDSDNTSANIGFSGLEIDTAAALAFVGSGNGLVTLWYDQTGSGKDLIADSGEEPHLITNGSLASTSLGESGILFDDDNARLHFNSQHPWPKAAGNISFYSDYEWNGNDGGQSVFCIMYK
ncbi:MAG: hypothetical protein HQL32_16950, partial [Planctomycetes bacterium]|nr:hypothetical protein [Planctomycetota bacterium]